MENLDDKKNVFSKEEIKKQIKNIIGDAKEDEIKLIFKYHLNLDGYKKYYSEKNVKVFSEEEKEKIDKLYLNKIEKAKTEFILDRKEIKELISMVSLAPIFDEKLPILELPIEKSLRVFNNVKTIYLIYSLESESRFKEIRDKIERKYPNVKVIGKEIENDITKIYKYLKELYNKKAINSMTTLLDLTNGMKLSSIAIYKFAVEKNVKVINWIEKQLSKYKILEGKENFFEELDSSERIPFSLTLEIMKEPIVETRKSQKSLNIAFEHQDYEIVKSFYESLEEEDRVFFFEQLNEFINFETISSLSSDLFYEKARSFIKNIFLYKNFNSATKEKIKNFLMILIALAFYENNGETYIDNEFWKINEDDDSYKLKKIGIDTETFLEIPPFFVTEEGETFRDEAYYYLVIKFFKNKIAVEKNAKKILEFLKINIFKDLKNEKIKNFDDLLKILLKNKSEKVIEYLEYLNIEEKFIEEITSEIKLKDGILKIEKLGIEFDLSKDKKIRDIFYSTTTGKERDTKFVDIFKEILANDNYRIDRTSFIEKHSINNIGELSKYSNTLKKFNDYIKEKLTEVNSEIVDNFLILSRNKYIKEKSFSNKLQIYPVKINEKFYL